MITRKVLSCCVFLYATAAMAQTDSSLTTVPFVQEKRQKAIVPSLIAPAVTIAYGCISLESAALRQVDREVQSFLQYRNRPFRGDDYLQYLPVAAVYGLNLAGVKGKNRLLDRTIILGMSTLLTVATVKGGKQLTQRLRPDGHAANSFPSGHTATAFMGATFLWMEYKDTHLWYGIAGYALATGTGILRVYNNRHWLSDVVMGAGIGILNTRLAYWMYPAIQRALFKKDTNISLYFSPFTTGDTYGMSMQLRF